MSIYFFYFRAKFLVVAKSHWHGSFRIVAFDGLNLFDINVSTDYMGCIQPGYTYQFQLLNPWDPTVVASQPIAVQGEIIPVNMFLYGMFAALGNIASRSFGTIFPNLVLEEQPYMIVGNTIQAPSTPRAFLVQGHLIRRQTADDGKTRCFINTDVGEMNLRFTGCNLEIYNGLPLVYDPNLVFRHYTLILVVADPISNPSWNGTTRNYILVVAIY